MRLPDATARWAMLSDIPSQRTGPESRTRYDVEGGELADAEGAVDHLAAADQQHGGEPEVRQEAHQRRVEGLQPGRDHALLEDAVDGVA